MKESTSRDRGPVQTAVRTLILGCVLSGTAPAFAQTNSGPSDLATATLEELMNMRVTTASRREQRIQDVPAAVFVITQEDIRRSGLTTLPEIFRLVPGMQVARINSSKWAVSVRGFNGLYADKLLVLVDGRSIYNRAFSGVFWEAQDVMVTDIDRIEVIRGPGGSVWGANAVNGIVNIITRSAAETQGTTVHASLGTLERDRVNVRYGGFAGGLAYRVFAQWSEHAETKNVDGGAAGDGWHSVVSGFRTDWKRGANDVMTQGHFMAGSSSPNWLALSSLTPGAPLKTTGEADLDEVTFVGRWTHTRPGGALFEAQAFNSASYHDDYSFQSHERTSDVDVQYQTALGARHDLVVGGGYRRATLSTEPTVTFSLGSSENSVASAFAQDEITLGRGVRLALGTKLERDTGAGWGLLPSARVMWELPTGGHLWGAVSRARRTPSAVDRNVRINAAALPGFPVPTLIAIVGNPDYQSEELLATEAGYRVGLGPNADVEAAVFRGRYHNLRSIHVLRPVFEPSPSPPHLLIAAQFRNELDADTTGLEVNGRWMPSNAWRLSGAYSAMHVSPHPTAANLDPKALDFDAAAPQHQWQARSTWLLPRTELGLALYRTGQIRTLDVPAYTRLDALLEFKVTDRLTAIVNGQNLSRSEHLEFSAVSVQQSLIPRSARVQLRWRY